MIKEAIYKLINHEDLTYEESLAVMGEMMDGTATQAQMGGFLTALRMQGETIDEITAFATVMREKGVSRVTFLGTRCFFDISKFRVLMISCCWDFFCFCCVTACTSVSFGS